MLRTAAACLLLNAVYITLRVTGTPLGLLRPFASGVLWGRVEGIRVIREVLEPPPPGARLFNDFFLHHNAYTD